MIDLSLRFSGCSRLCDLPSPLHEFITLSCASLVQEISDLCKDVGDLHTRGDFGIDQGMSDISINQEMLDKYNSISCFLDMVTKWIESSTAFADFKGVTPALRVYDYKNCLHPRPCHFDTWKYTLKIFIPLTDVKNARDGYYYYVPYTHLVSRPVRVIRGILSLFSNRKRPRIDYDLPGWLKPLLKLAISYTPASLGQYYITRQDGYHGDYPQSEGGSRRALVVILNKNGTN